MKIFALTTFALFSFATALTCQEAYNECDFKFFNRDGIPTFWLGGPPDVAFSTYIMAKDTNMVLGVLNAAHDAEFIVDGDVYSVQEYGHPPMSPHEFKPFPMPFNSRKSGIGHETMHGDGLEITRGKCIRVSFSEFQVLYTNGNVKRNANNVPKSAHKCVVFKAYK